MLKKTMCMVNITLIMITLLTGCGVSAFAIEGTWIETGEDGWGEGRVVVFDTDNRCNLYSPMDTYAIEKQGKYYALNITSLLGESMTYTVNVIDNNNIEIYYPGDKPDNAEPFWVFRKSGATEYPNPATSPSATLSDSANEPIIETTIPTEDSIGYKEYAIIECEPFSEGLAWVTYSQDGIEKKGTIDTEGNLVFSLYDTPVYCSPFIDGLAFCIMEGKPSYEFYFVDVNGNELYWSSNDGKGGYILLGYGEGHFLVAQHIETFDTNEWRLGTIDEYGNILNDMTAEKDIDSIIDKLYPREYAYKYNEDHLYNFEYLGENVMSICRRNGWLYDTSKGALYNLNSTIITGKFHDGVTLVKGDTGTLLLTADNLHEISSTKSRLSITNRNFTILPDGPDGSGASVKEYVGENARYYAFYTVNAYNEGVIWGYNEAYNNGAWTNKNYYGYYNMNGDSVILFPNLEGKTFQGAPFNGGYAALRIIGADKKVYVTVVDKAGKFQYEPIQVDDFNVLESYNGYVWVTVNGKGFIMSRKGDLMTAGVDDLSGVGTDAKLTSSVGYPELSEGFFVFKPHNNHKTVENGYVSLDGKAIIQNVRIDD